jgi:hypothetical protein
MGSALLTARQVHFDPDVARLDARRPHQQTGNQPRADEDAKHDDQRHDYRSTRKILSKLGNLQIPLLAVIIQ